MKYYLKIDGTEYHNCSDLQITGTYRMQNVQTALSGDLLIDRIGGEKLTVSAKISAITPEEFKALLAAKDAIFSEWTFDRGDKRETHTMYIQDFSEPAPIYYFGDKEKGLMYGAITVTAEEK